MALKRPVNPFALGGAFIEWAREKGWIEVEEVGRCRNYYITSMGDAKMREMGVNIDNLFRFMPLSEEDIAKQYEAERKAAKKSKKTGNASKRR